MDPSMEEGSRLGVKVLCFACGINAEPPLLFLRISIEKELTKKPARCEESCEKPAPWAFAAFRLALIVHELAFISSLLIPGNENHINEVKTM